MITIERDYVTRVRAATSPEELHALVQAAIKLELATIPPYLCAWFTLKPGTNSKIATILKRIAFDEMLHMTIMCNLLIALKGAPQMADAGSVPTYPGKLPMSVGNSVEVTLEKCSVGQIERVFMKIEEPGKPLEFPIKLKALPTFATIGEFYDALVTKLEELGDGAFKGDFNLEVLEGFNSTNLFEINNVESARRAIRVVVAQGEGTTVSPADPRGLLAHYYRFKQVVVGKELVKDPTVPQGWSYSGPALAIDTNQVWDMDENPKAAKYPSGTEARIAADRFNAEYSALLRGLERAFNGKKETIGAMITAMESLSDTAQEVLAVPSPTGRQTGLPFELVP